MDTGRIRNPELASRVTSPEAAAAMIPAGANVGMSGFTGAGYPKAVPAALAERIAKLNAGGGEPFKVNVWTGASTAPELDGALAAADGIDLRLPYQSDPVTREKINSGQMQYTDVHLSHVAQMAWEGFFGDLDVAVVEVSGITEDGKLIPSSSVGNNKTWLDRADKIILEVNTWQSPGGPVETCNVCHGTGIAGAPKVGDKAAWGPRIAQGPDTLYKHAMDGFTGKSGAMPPKGGNLALKDAEVKAAVDYMVSQAK